MTNIITLTPASIPTGGPSTLMQASRQWATRPDDERFTSLTDLHSHVASIRNNSRAAVVASRDLHAIPVDGDSKGLQIVGPSGNAADVSHWAFAQLAQRAGAPAGYLRDLPAPLAADCVNYGLQFSRDVEDLGVLLTKQDNAPATLRAVTGPQYGRIWNETIARALVDRFGDGITGSFRVPGEFGKAVDVTKENTSLYASDRDMFVFLADEERRIEVPNRRDGKAGSLARGFFVWNSEVGSATFGIGMFLFDYVCQNRIVWGAQGYKEIKVRHTAGAPHRWIEEVAPAIHAFAESSAAPMQTLLLAAQQKRVDDLDAFLRTRFTNGQANGIKAAHLADEGRPMETLWDVATGVTAYARGVKHQDARVEIEREGGRILAMAA
jgi:hypothetical protein